MVAFAARGCLLLAACLLLALASHVPQVAAAASQRLAPSGAAPAVPLPLRRRLQLRAWPKLQTLEGLETLWEVPSSPTAVLFVAHGCNHGAEDFWPRSPRCPHCLGLPQERLVRLAALRRGYAVVAVSSFDRDTKCWHNTQADRSEDLKRLPTILRRVMEEEGLQGLPLYAFGASSGGGIVLRLAQVMPEVQGVVAQIVPARPELVEAPDGRAYPVLFVHMAQHDPEWAAQIADTLEFCREEGIPADEVWVDPQPVTQALLRTSPLVSAALADAVVGALRDGGFLDEQGYLLEDPREGAQHWQAALQPVLGPPGERLVGAHVAQLLNVAYAQHELTGWSTDAALAWLEAGGRADIRELLLAEEAS